MNAQLQSAFAAIGAELEINSGDRAFEIDILRQEDREAFQLTYPWDDEIIAEAIDVRPKRRHLVLDVTGWRRPISGRYLCGHDERHWFVAQVPFGAQTMTVRGAMEALKPEIVLREQKRKGVKHRRHRRKTAAYIRQGEWFFLPRPKMHVGEAALRDGELAREGGKPHQVEWIYRTPGADDTFVRGAVSHPDHETIYLQVWHRVVMNNEGQPAPEARDFTRMMFVD